MNKKTVNTKMKKALIQPSQAEARAAHAEILRTIDWTPLFQEHFMKATVSK